MQEYLTELSQEDENVQHALDFFNCPECRDWNGRYYYYEPLENLITLFPEKQLIHVHFGKPSWNESLTKEEAEWVYEVTQIQIDEGPTPILTICDFSHIDDSEFPTKESITTYAKAVAREASAQVISYGGSFAMQMILKLIGGFNVAVRKMTFAVSREEAMKKYYEWIETLQKK